MKVLVLSDRVFSSSLGDGLRFGGLLRPLAEKHRFDLVCFSRNGEELDPKMRRLFTDVRLVPMPPPRRRPFARRLQNALYAGDFVRTSDEMRETVGTAIESGCYDAVLDAGAYSIPNIPSRLRRLLPLVADSVDEAIVREARAIRQAPWFHRAKHVHKIWQYWAFAKHSLADVAINIYASDLDAAVYRRLFPSRKVAIVPNGVDVRFFAPVSEPRDPACVVFEGNMNFGPNVDTAMRLVNEVLPLILRRVPNAYICLVGRNPSPGVRALASSKVRVTGTVEDIRPYLGKAAVFACPMRLGSGIKNKILQAWAMGVPVVATSESLGGLAAVNGSNLLVRDGVADFADAVADLMLDTELASRIGKAGRNCVETEYSWEHQAARLETVLVEAIEQFRSSLSQATPAMSPLARKL